MIKRKVVIIWDIKGYKSAKNVFDNKYEESKKIEEYARKHNWSVKRLKKYFENHYGAYSKSIFEFKAHEYKYVDYKGTKVNLDWTITRRYNNHNKIMKMLNREYKRKLYSNTDIAKLKGLETIDPFELFLTEGESAKAGVRSPMRTTHDVFPIKGKLLTSRTRGLDSSNLVD